MNENKSPSDVLQEFLDYLESCRTEYETAKADMEKEDAKKQDFLHSLEFEDNCKKRSIIATQAHLSRKKRRASKDKVERLEKVVVFMSSERNKPFLKTIRGLIKEQKRTEEYLNSERVYKLRGGSGNEGSIQSENNS